MAKTQNVSEVTLPKTTPTPEEFQNHYDSIFESDPNIDGNTFADGIDSFHATGEDYYLPSKDEILAAGEVAQWEKSGIDITGAGEVAWEVLKRAPRSVASSFIKSFQGAKGADVVDPDYFERFAQNTDKENQAFMREVEEKYQNRRLMPGIEINDIGEMAQNLGFSGAAATAGLAVGAPLSLIPVAGKPLAYLAGASAAGTVAYNASGYDFMKEVLDYRDGQKFEETGQHLTAEEQEQIKAESMTLAQQHGLWEAIPEALGSAVGFNMLMRPLTQMFGKHLATRVAQKIAGVYIPELATETLTQMGQNEVRFEAAKWGLLDPKTAQPVDWTSYEQWKTAVKDVAPQVFLLTTALGAGTSVGSKAWNSLVANKETRDNIAADVC
jgi:hypothetical protein